MNESDYKQIKVSQGCVNQAVGEMQKGPVLSCKLNFAKFKCGHCSWEKKKKKAENHGNAVVESECIYQIN